MIDSEWWSADIYPTALYNEESHVELSDRKQFSAPAVVTRLRSSKTLHAKTRADPERFDALERVGFKVDRFGDFFRHVNERQGGHYVDVGASAKIAQGLVCHVSNKTDFDSQGARSRSSPMPSRYPTLVTGCSSATASS